LLERQEERDQHEEPEEAEDDAGYSGEHLHEEADRPPEHRRCQFDEKYSHHDADSPS